MNHVESQPPPSAFSFPKHRTSWGYRNAYKTKDHVTQNVAMQLKDSDKNVSGDLARFSQNFLDEFEQAAEDYYLENSKRLQSIQN